MRTVKVPERPFLETHANTLHLNLKFTSELESEDGIAFLDLKVRRTGNGMECNWYRKSTDTGVTMNYNATTPNVYKSGLVAGFVHRIFNTTTNWNDFVNSISIAENILRDNQFPKAFVQKIVSDTLTKILDPMQRLRSRTEGRGASEKLED